MDGPAGAGPAAIQQGPCQVCIQFDNCLSPIEFAGSSGLWRAAQAQKWIQSMSQIGYKMPDLGALNTSSSCPRHPTRRVRLLPPRRRWQPCPRQRLSMGLGMGASRPEVALHLGMYTAFAPAAAMRAAASGATWMQWLTIRRSLSNPMSANTSVELRPQRTQPRPGAGAGAGSGSGSGSGSGTGRC